MTLTIYPELIQGSDAARFWNFVKKGTADSCWEWQSTTNQSGYGKFWLHGKTVIAHRVSFLINNGPIPLGEQIRHTCDNPPCVNPKRLLTGTGKENAADALKRDKYRRGSRNGRARLTEDQVIEIRNGWRQGETQVSMARRFGVSKSAIQWVLNGRNWAHLGSGV
jgi:hypothetical protein